VIHIYLKKTPCGGGYRKNKNVAKKKRAIKKVTLKPKQKKTGARRMLKRDNKIAKPTHILMRGNSINQSGFTK